MDRAVRMGIPTGLQRTTRLAAVQIIPTVISILLIHRDALGVGTQIMRVEIQITIIRPAALLSRQNVVLEHVVRSDADQA